MVFMVSLRMKTHYSNILLMFMRRKCHSWVANLFSCARHTFISSTVSFARGISNPLARMQYIKLNCWAGLFMYGFPDGANDIQLIIIKLISTCIALCILDAHTNVN